MEYYDPVVFPRGSHDSSYISRFGSLFEVNTQSKHAIRAGVTGVSAAATELPRALSRVDAEAQDIDG